MHVSTVRFPRWVHHQQFSAVVDVRRLLAISALPGQSAPRYHAAFRWTGKIGHAADHILEYQARFIGRGLTACN